MIIHWKKAQAILDYVLVFIALAVFSVGITRIWTWFDANYVKRQYDYQQSRLVTPGQMEDATARLAANKIYDTSKITTPYDLTEDWVFSPQGQAVGKIPHPGVTGMSPTEECRERVLGHEVKDRIDGSIKFPAQDPPSGCVDTEGNLDESCPFFQNCICMLLDYNVEAQAQIFYDQACKAGRVSGLCVEADKLRAQAQGCDDPWEVCWWGGFGKTAQELHRAADKLDIQAKELKKRGDRLKNEADNIKECCDRLLTPAEQNACLYTISSESQERCPKPKTQCWGSQSFSSCLGGEGDDKEKRKTCMGEILNWCQEEKLKGSCSESVESAGEQIQSAKEELLDDAFIAGRIISGIRTNFRHRTCIRESAGSLECARDKEGKIIWGSVKGDLVSEGLGIIDYAKDKVSDSCRPKVAFGEDRSGQNVRYYRAEGSTIDCLIAKGYRICTSSLDRDCDDEDITTIPNSDFAECFNQCVKNNSEEYNRICREEFEYIIGIYPSPREGGDSDVTGPTEPIRAVEVRGRNCEEPNANCDGDTGVKCGLAKYAENLERINIPLLEAQLNMTQDKIDRLKGANAIVEEAGKAEEDKLYIIKDGKYPGIPEYLGSDAEALHDYSTEDKYSLSSVCDQNGSPRNYIHGDCCESAWTANEQNKCIQDIASSSSWDSCQRRCLSAEYLECVPAGTTVSVDNPLTVAQEECLSQIESTCSNAQIINTVCTW